MELSFWAATDVGKKREINEDNFLVDKKLSLFVVADGMGGHASGEVASQLAVHEFRNAVEAGHELLEHYAKGDADDRAAQEVLTLLENAVQTAGQAIYHKGAGRAGEARDGDHHARPCSSPGIAGSSPTSATAGSTCCAPARSCS